MSEEDKKLKDICHEIHDYIVDNLHEKEVKIDEASIIIINLCVFMLRDIFSQLDDKEELLPPILDGLFQAVNQMTINVFKKPLSKIMMDAAMREFQDEKEESKATLH